MGKKRKNRTRKEEGKGGSLVAIRRVNQGEIMGEVEAQD